MVLFAFVENALAINVDQILKSVPTVSWELVREQKHSSDFFTQGLCFNVEGVLFEGTGQYGASRLIKYKKNSMEVERSLALSPRFFGEGVTVLNGQVFQLTWRKNRCFVYDATSLKREKVYRYQHEGWGITHDTSSLIISDGSPIIRYYTPGSFQLKKIIAVKVKGQRLPLLNELEYIKGKIWANVWQTNYVVCIDPKTGEVTHKFDFSALDKLQQGKDKDVLNGVAYNPVNGEIWVSGKYWDRLYSIKLKELP